MLYFLSESDVGETVGNSNYQMLLYLLHPHVHDSPQTRAAHRLKETSRLPHDSIRVCLKVSGEKKNSNPERNGKKKKICNRQIQQVMMCEILANPTP